MAYLRRHWRLLLLALVTALLFDAWVRSGVHDIWAARAVAAP